MKVILFFSLASLTGYIIGYILGRYTAEQEIYEKRSEMELEPEPEDILDKLFKE